MVSRDGSRLKSDSRGQPSDESSSDDNGSEGETDAIRSSQHKATSQDTVNHVSFWTRERESAARILASQHQYSSPHPHSVEDVLRRLEKAASTGTLVAILGTMKELDGLRWLANGNHSESRMIIWANSLQGERYHESRLAAKVDYLEIRYYEELERILIALRIVDAQLRREIEVALEATVAAALENDQFKVSRAAVLVKDSLAEHMQELVSNKYPVECRYWDSLSATDEGRGAGTLVFWDQPEFTSLLDMWLLAESKKQSETILQCFRAISAHQSWMYQRSRNLMLAMKASTNRKEMTFKGTLSRWYDGFSGLLKVPSALYSCKRWVSS